MRQDDKVIVVEGIVKEILPGSFYSVQLIDNNQVIRATVSGKMRMNKIRILPGDKVTLTLSIYDLTQGRITYRSK